MQILHKGAEVIEQGLLLHAIGKWPKARICTGDGNGQDGCGSALLVEESDIYQTTHNYRGYALNGVQPFLTKYYLTFRCPCCNAETDITEGRHDPYLPLTEEQKQVVAKR